MNVGFTGGSSIVELGPPSDIQYFFDCVKLYARNGSSGDEWSLLTDRFYRRYLKFEEIEKAANLMTEIKEIFSNIPGAPVDFKNEETFTRLDSTKTTLAELFAKYFDAFAHCAESAKLNYESFKLYPGYKYEPVRVVISDTPGFVESTERPLEEYDQLKGQPFWLRKA